MLYCCIIAINFRFLLRKDFFHEFLGNIGFRFCAKGSTTTAPEAPYPAPRASRSAYPVPVALLRRRRQFHVRGHVETPHDPLSKSYVVCLFTFNCFPFFKGVLYAKNCFLIHFICLTVNEVYICQSLCNFSLYFLNYVDPVSSFNLP